MHSSEDLPAIVAVILLGMAIPVLLAVRFHDLLSLYLSGGQLTFLGAVAYGLVVWLLVARYDLDRVNVVLASIVFPVVGAGVLLLVGLAMTDLHEGFRYLFRDVGDLFTYAAGFGLAGITAVGVLRKTEQLAEARAWTSPPQTIPILLVSLIVLGLLAGGIIGHISARSAAVSAFEPDTTPHGKPVLNVTVESPPTELRLTVTAPDDSTTTHRITRRALQDGSTTVSIEFWEFEGQHPQAGTYNARVASVVGVTVDTATHTIDQPPTPALLRTETAAPGEPLDLDLPADSVVYRPRYDTETRVAVVLQNEGDVAARFYVRIFTAEERLASREIPLEPGQQGANIFELSREEVDRIHADADGTVSIEIVYEDERIRTTAELPDPE